MARFSHLCLAAAVAGLALPAWADLVYTSAGSYNAGSSSGPGATAAAGTSCGSLSGRDTQEFNGVGANNIGIHAYACDNQPGVIGARASGENTYFAQGTSSIIGTVGGTDAKTFDFIVDAGQVGVFGSSAFVAGEFQRASLTIKLIIDGTTYMDESWSAQVSTGGAISASHASNGSLSLATALEFGSGYFSWDITGNSFSIPLLALPNGDDHNISYVMTSEAAGNIRSTTSCTAVLASAPHAPFGAVCGAGATVGDPNNDPIATATGQLPEPMTAGLTLAALLAAAGARRRSRG